MAHANGTRPGRSALSGNAEAAIGLLDKVQYRTIAAIHQCEVVAEQPLVPAELAFHNCDHAGQTLLAERDGILITTEVRNYAL
jgi:hypothetical protein